MRKNFASRRALLVIALALSACGDGLGLSSTTDGGMPPPDLSQSLESGVVICGTSHCNLETERCIALRKENALQPPACVPNDFEPPTLGGNLRIDCDDDGDCVNGERCIYLRGEDDRFSCVPESEQTGCNFHATHVCTSSAACHECANQLDPPTVYTCKPHAFGGLTIGTCSQF